MEELDLLLAELGARLLDELRRGEPFLAADELAVGVAAQPATRSPSAAQPRERLRRLLAARADVAPDDDRRVVRHLGENGLQRGEVAVDVVERRDRRQSVDDLELEPPPRLYAAGADDRAQSTREPPCRPITLPTSPSAT